MNILRVMGCPSYNFSNQERYIINLEKKLKLKGHELHLIYDDYVNDEFLSEIKKNNIQISVMSEKYKNIQVEKNKFLRHVYNLFNIKKINYFIKYIKDNDIDLVHSYFSPSLSAMIAGKVMNIPTVKTMSNPFIHIGKGLDSFTLRLKSFFLHIFPLIFIDKQICLSKEILDEFNSFLIDKKKIILINSGVDTAYFDEDKSFDLRREYNLPLDSFIIGFTGRLSKQKNLFFLIDAFHKVSMNVANSYLFIVGDGELKHSINSKINDLKLNQKIITTGRLPNIPAIVSNFDIFVLTSLYEGMPGSLLEAMSLQKPSVVSDIKVHREIISNYQDGIISDNNVKDFSESIIKLHKDKEKRKKMGIRARDKVVKNFSSDKRAHSTIKLYESLV